MRRDFYYITHKDNLISILEKGIFSRDKIEKENIHYKKIHNQKVVDRRKTIPLPNKKMLTEYVNLFLQPRNAMMYVLFCNLNAENIVILQVNVTNTDDCFIADGNAAANETTFYPYAEGMKKIDTKILNREYWSDQDGSKRKIMAEALIPNSIPSSQITTIYTCNETARQKIQEKIETTSLDLQAVREPEKFFYPSERHRVSENVSLAKGDMFFSNMQTFTISVNIKGVMGKGLASRTKYQFPDAYVKYQDDCRARKLKMGKPTIYKRASRIEEELADKAVMLEESKLNGSRWFLFFPTKDDWRNDSRIEEIEKGLQWLVKNYKKEGIESIALPALGCGLGNLQWKDVGPLMCRYLNKMEIQSCVYLPVEKSIDSKYLRTEYLLADLQ